MNKMSDNTFIRNMNIPHWQKMIGQHNISKGFVFPDKDLEFWKLTMLMVTELAELVEDYYTHGKITSEGKIELADIAIRLFDFCDRRGVDLEGEMIKKMKLNVNRPFRHGKKG